jgi:hypothetical protein
MHKDLVRIHAGSGKKEHFMAIKKASKVHLCLQIAFVSCYPKVTKRVCTLLFGFDRFENKDVRFVSASLHAFLEM